MRGWLTPEALPAGTVCRLLRIPDDPTWIAPVTGAILYLTQSFNFEQFGVTTPEEAAQRYGEMLDEFLDAGFSNCMIGVVFPYATTNPPNGALPCDGSSFNRTDYPALYAALDPSFIVDSDTFTTPNLAGRVVVGAGSGSGLSPYTVGQIGGEENHVLTVSELASHAHSDAGHVHTEVAAVASTIPPGEIPIPLPASTPFPTTTGIGYADIQSTGGDEGHNNIQPFQALKYGIWWR